VKKLDLHRIVFLCSVLLLSACLGPKTPQETTQVFWKSVINNQIEDVAEYSTLVDVKHYDGFSKNWSEFQPAWGKVVIDGDRARVESTFTKTGDSEAANREFMTYLIRRNEKWIVDYPRTHQAVQGDVISNMLGAFSQASKNISAHIEAAASEFRSEMKRMHKEVGELSTFADQQVSTSIERLTQALRESIKELEASVNRALKEHDKNLSGRDRRVLREAAIDLNRDRKNLSQPTMQTVARGRKNLGEVHKQLDSIDDQVAENYKQKWQRWHLIIETDIKRLSKELSESDQAEE
jgi:hypothetical protein